MSRLASGFVRMLYRIKIFAVLVMVAVCHVVSLAAYDSSGDKSKTPVTTDHLSLLELKQMADSIYFRSDHRDNAELLYKQLMKRATGNLSASDEKIMAAAYSNYATFLIFERNNPILAYPLLKRSLSLLDKYKSDGLCVISTYTNLSHIYANFNDTIKALNYLVLGFDNTLRTKKPERAGYIYAQLLYMAWDFGRLDSIQRQIKVFGNDRRLFKGRLYEYNIELSKAVNEYSAGSYAEASERLVNSVEILDPEYDIGVYKAMTLLMAADASLHAGDKESARSLIIRAEKDLGNYEEFNGREFLNKIRAEYYRATGNNAMAREYEIRSLLMRDSLYNARNMTSIADLEQNLLTTRYNEELTKSHFEQEILSERSKRQRVLLIVLSISSAIIITLLIFLSHRKRKLTETRYRLLLEKLGNPKTEPEITVGDQNSGNRDASGDIINRQGTDTHAEDDNLKDIYRRVTDFFSTRDEIYDCNFNIDEMSRLMNVSVKHISKAVNMYYGKNFSLCLADYRIKKACHILCDSGSATRPKIEYVAELVGYRSRSHFSRTFKAVTELTTSEFIKKSQKHK